MKNGEGMEVAQASLVSLLCPPVKCEGYGSRLSPRYLW